MLWPGNFHSARPASASCAASSDGTGRDSRMGLSPPVVSLRESVVKAVSHKPSLRRSPPGRLGFFGQPADGARNCLDKRPSVATSESEVPPSKIFLLHG